MTNPNIDRAAPPKSKATAKKRTSKKGSKKS
jgi:hypothetical protein